MTDLPLGWVKAPLLDILDLHDSRRIPLNATQRADRKGPYPYYGANGQVDSIDDYIFDGDYILLAEDGGYFDNPSRGVAYEASGKFWVNNHAHILSTVADVPRRFVTFALNNTNWLPFVSGTTRLKLTQQGMRQVELPLPPLAEQRRIVGKLDSLTGAIARARAELDRIPTLIARNKQEILSAAFSGELTNAWRAKHGIAPDAPVLPLGEVAEDFSYGSSAKSSKQGEVPVLRMGNIQDGKIDWEDLVYTSDPAEMRKYSLEAGDVLFNRTNSPELVGKTAVFRAERRAIFAGYLIRVRCSDELLPDYLAYCLNSPQGRQYAWRVKTDGVSQSNINAKKLAAFVFRLPSVDEQREIVRRVQTSLDWLDRVAAEQGNASRLLPRLDQAILARAFRGELVPRDPNDEPASVLLERIYAARETATKPKRGRKQPEGRISTVTRVKTAKTQIEEELEAWPDRGLTFEEIASRIDGDYEDVRGAIFDLLAGPSPVLAQDFDERGRLMRIRKAPA